jgi:hypothetical protein
LAPAATGVGCTVAARLFLGREHEVTLQTSSRRRLLLRFPSLEAAPAVGAALHVHIRKAVLFLPG